MTEWQKTFWTAQLEQDKEYPDRVVIIRGSHYIIGDEDTKGSRGFDGGKFEIRFFDGRVVTTTNLWHQGTIPEEMKDLFPDNAEFDWQWKKIGDCDYLIPF